MPYLSTDKTDDGTGFVSFTAEFRSPPPSLLFSPSPFLPGFAPPYESAEQRVSGHAATIIGQRVGETRQGKTSPPMQVAVTDGFHCFIATFCPSGSCTVAVLVYRKPYAVRRLLPYPDHQE